MSIDAVTLRDELRRERRRHFDQQRLVAPLGVMAAALTFTLVTEGMLDASLRWAWFGAMCAVVASMVIAHARPLAALLLDDGIPLSAHLAHVAVGAGCGLVLWIDLDATRVPEFKWLATTLLVALTAGAGAGLSGSNVLGRNLVLTVWGLAIPALLTAGQVITAVALTVFVIVMLHEIRSGGESWQELVRLRLMSGDEASRNRHAAAHDSLTGLLNRTGLRDGFEEFPATDRSAIYLDLDGFKKVNDAFGHRAGDQVLRVVAERLLAATPQGALVARFGGDEFVVVVPHGSGREFAAVLRACAAAIATPIVSVDVEPVQITASIGSATASADVALDDLLDLADQHQYRVKRSRNPDASPRRPLSTHPGNHARARARPIGS